MGLFNYKQNLNKLPGPIWKIKTKNARHAPENAGKILNEVNITVKHIERAIPAKPINNIVFLGREETKPA